MDWLKGSTLDSADQNNAYRAIMLRMKKGNEKVTVAVHKTVSGKKGDYVIFPNIPNTNVEDCMSSFEVHGDNLPDAARRFIKNAGIGNPKGLKI